MKFFFDNCIPPPLVRAIAAIEKAHDLIHQMDCPVDRDADDPDWMKYAASEGMIAITVDNKILRRPGERKARKAYELCTVFLHGAFGSQDIWLQAAFIFRTWPSITKYARSMKNGQCVRVKNDGKLDPLENP